MQSVDVIVNADDLVIIIKGLFGKMISLCDRISIPVEYIESISDGIRIEPSKTIKVMGTHFGSLYAGTFYVFGKGKVFYYFKNKKTCVTVCLKSDYKRFKELILQVNDKEKTLNDIQSVLKKR